MTLFKVQKFATIRLSSSDVEKSRDWYQKLFEVDPVEDLKNFASFKVSETTLEICLADEKSPLSPGGSVGYWRVDNLDGAISKAVQLGGSVYRGPLMVRETGLTIVQIKDPVGNVIAFESLSAFETTTHD